MVGLRRLDSDSACTCAYAALTSDSACPYRSGAVPATRDALQLQDSDVIKRIESTGEVSGSPDFSPSVVIWRNRVNPNKTYRHTHNSFLSFNHSTAPLFSPLRVSFSPQRSVVFLTNWVFTMAAFPLSNKGLSPAMPAFSDPNEEVAAGLHVNKRKGKRPFNGRSPAFRSGATIKNHDRKLKQKKTRRSTRKKSGML